MSRSAWGGPLRAGEKVEVGREVTEQHKSCLRGLFDIRLPLRLSRAEPEPSGTQSREPRRAGGKVALYSRGDKGFVTSSRQEDMMRGKGLGFEFLSLLF